MKKKTVRRGSTATNKRMRRVNAKTRRNRTRRGGSTTEQIGAAAQMRAYFPYNALNDHQVHQALNQVVHHEDASNRFHDTAFNYDPYAQEMIDEAYRIIKNNADIDPAIKMQMKIAKRKASKSNGLPQIVVQPKSSVPVEDFPGLPVLPRPVKVPVAIIHAPHLDQVAMHPPPLVGTVDTVATKNLFGLMKLKNKNR